MSYGIDPDIQARLSDARVLVTGGNGFIGSHLTRALLEAGAVVKVIDRHSVPTTTNDTNDGSVPYQGEATRRLSQHVVELGSDAFAQLLRREGPFDYIFHLAARAYAAASFDTPYLDFTTNLVGTMHLLEQMRDLQMPTHLIFASTAAVYGEPEKLPIEETDATLPVSPYGVSKLAAERYVAVYSRMYDMQGSSLRLFSVYGPGQSKQVVYDFFKKLRANPNELVVLGDGSQRRDLVYVKDVVSAFLTVAVRGKADGTTYNVASGISTSTADLAHMVVETQNLDAKLTFTGKTRPGDPDRWQASSTRLTELGWQPRYSLRDGLRETAAWFNTTGEPSAENGLVKEVNVA